MKKLGIELPSLSDYRQNFFIQGVITPLPIVPFSKNGLLAELPPPPVGKTGWPWTEETQPPATTMPNGLPWSKISIVMPSYNQGQFIEETIRSVLLQNYPNLEYIICDGDSNDETQKILEKYSPWLSFWQSKKDRGQGHAINLGFSIASGDYFGWVNSDDLYLANCFQLVATHFSKHKSDFVYGDSISLYQNDTKTYYSYGKVVLDRYLRFGGLIASHAAFWKSTIHAPICETISCAIDYELWLRLLPRKARSHLKAPLGVFRVQPQSKSSHARYQTLWKSDREKIFSTYGLSPQRRSFILYEFWLIQLIYRRFMKIRKSRNVESFIQRCS